MTNLGDIERHEEVMRHLGAHTDSMRHLQDGISHLFARIELIERKLQENHIGE